MSSRIKSCFISAPGGSNLSTLQQALDERGVRIAVPDEYSAGTSWKSEMTRVLSDVDLVIGVLTRERRSDWILFELGQAWARNRQILLFAPPKSGLHLPFDLKGVLVVRASLRNREAIEFALDQLIAAPERQPHSEPQLKPRQGLEHRADAFLREANDAVQSRQGLELERILETALRESGVEVLSAEPMSDQRVDLAVWSDSFQRSVGNPLLVEIKTRVFGKVEARHAAFQLTSHLTSSGTRWGLLVYGEGPSSKALQQSMPSNVLAIPLNELLERMRHEPFAEVVNDLRNRRVHGLVD